MEKFLFRLWRLITIHRCVLRIPLMAINHFGIKILKFTPLTRMNQVSAACWLELQGKMDVFPGRIDWFLKRMIRSITTFSISFLKTKNYPLRKAMGLQSILGILALRLDRRSWKEKIYWKVDRILIINHQARCLFLTLAIEIWVLI